MSRFSGPQQPQPFFRRGRNKGVLRHLRHLRRMQAEDREADRRRARRQEAES